MDKLSDGIQFVKGVGPQRSKLLHKLEIQTVFDLLWNVPRSYLNLNKVMKISALSDNMTGSIRGRVTAVGCTRTRRGFNLLKAVVEDDSGTVTAVWFNQPYLARQIRAGQEVFLSGRLKNSYGMNEFNVAEYELIDGDDLYIPIIPVYPLTEGLSQKALRKIVLSALNDYLSGYIDILDKQVRKRYDLCDIQYALRNIHFPASRKAFAAARRRLAFEELLLFRLSLLTAGGSLKTERPGIQHRARTDLVTRIADNLAFKLTQSQQHSLNEIIVDMESPRCMNRLLQGDVGSGKTVVAGLAMAQAVASGYQAAIMVPTEILAEQHYKSISSYFANTETVVGRLTGGMLPGQRRMVLESTAAGEIDILVGTQALIQGGVQFKNLGLVVIDEQHRFGVRQRAQLGHKGSIPDVLVMTATPIPRTLALALYGELNVSTINEIPPGRRVVKTAFIPRSSRNAAYRFIRAEVKKGAQAYIVCPLIEESETQDVQAALNLFEELRIKVYPDLKVGLLHGRMRHGEKEETVELFKRGDIDVLVTTTVIEVGMDISNACLMLVEHAERFGLSQLHQLRGRVGRGEKQSYCILVGEPKTEEAWWRLQAMAKISNGFELANEDLQIRGPGDFWGVKQHGLDEMKVANLLKDSETITHAYQAASEFGQQQIKDKQIDLYIARKFKKITEIAMN